MYSYLVASMLHKYNALRLLTQTAPFERAEARRVLYGGRKSYTREPAILRRCFKLVKDSPVDHVARMS